MGAVHRGEAALKAATPFALRQIGIATVVGFAAAAAYYAYSRGKHAEWAKWDREWAQHKVSKKKEMAAWLESQPYDDEVLAAAAATEKE